MRRPTRCKNTRSITYQLDKPGAWHHTITITTHKSFPSLFSQDSFHFRFSSQIFHFCLCGVD